MGEVKTTFTVEDDQAIQKIESYKKRLQSIENASVQTQATALTKRDQALAASTSRHQKFLESVRKSEAGLTKTIVGENLKRSQSTQIVIDTIKRIPGVNDRVANSVIGLTEVFGTLRVAGFGGLLAVGFALIKVTERLKENAEAQLRFIEKSVGEVNKLRLARLKERNAFAESLKLQERQAQFEDRTQGASLERLKAIRAGLQSDLRRREQIERLTGEQDKEAVRNRQQILKLNKLIREEEKARFEQALRFGVTVTRRGPSAREFQLKREAELEARLAKQRAAAQRKAELERRKEKRDREQALREVEKLQTGALSFFDSLRTSSTGNPFVRIFSEADRQIKRVRESTKGLSGDIERAALGFAGAASASDIFGARLQTCLSSGRAQAKRRTVFARPAKQPKAADTLGGTQTAINSFEAR